ncbi:MAG: hypothetical protein K0R84_1424 [Clostridia bacterium]|jgi:hypothetical protein|nr:hypothetical protein [Clostridia bacterium]
MYSITIDKVNKAFIANISGNVDVNQANVILKDFKNNAATINPKDYILIVNPENVSGNIFVFPILQSFLNLVAELKFKRIYLVNSDKNANLIEAASTLRFAGSVKEALNKH